MMSQKEIVFLKTLHQESNYHCVHIDQSGLIQPITASVHIQHVNSFMAAVYHATTRCAKNEIPKECKQARNQVGTLGRIKSFLGEAQIF